MPVVCPYRCPPIHPPSYPCCSQAAGLGFGAAGRRQRLELAQLEAENHKLKEKEHALQRAISTIESSLTSSNPMNGHQQEQKNDHNQQQLMPARSSAHSLPPGGP